MNIEQVSEVAAQAVELETYWVQQCRTCGAEYATPGVSRLHVHQDGFKRVKRSRPKVASRISYQPGYGPTS